MPAQAAFEFDEPEMELASVTQIPDRNIEEALERFGANAIIRMAKQLLRNRLRVPGEDMFSLSAVKDFLVLQLAKRESEAFCVMFLDCRHRLIAFEEMFHGTIDGASVHPREVVKRALQHNAAALLLAHNHPSQQPEPSGADERITRRLRDALALVDIRVIDHIVVGGTDTVSFAERGLI